MILAVALLNKTIAKSSHYYWSPLVTYWFMVKKGRRGNCPLFNEVWPRRALCLYFCVLLCECVSDAANCPFAVYPMGSGMSLVTACSFSLNGPVAMAALQRPAPLPPPSALRVTGQLEQGAVICSLLWLQLWGDRTSGGGGPYTGKVPTRFISKQTHWTTAPGGHVCFEDATSSSLHYMWHLPSNAVSSDTNRETSTNYNTQRALGTYHTPTGWLSSIILCWRSSSPVTRYTRCFAIILHKFVSIVKGMWQMNTSHRAAAGEWRNFSHLCDDEMIIERESVAQIVALNVSASL